MAARWPRKGAVSETLLTGPVSIAVCWLMMRCGLAVSGQRLRRWLSQSRIAWRVRSSSGPGPAGYGEPPVAEVDVIDLQFADRLRAGGVDGG
jgi:hypothetical protein